MRARKVFTEGRKSDIAVLTLGPHETRHVSIRGVVQHAGSKATCGGLRGGLVSKRVPSKKRYGYVYMSRASDRSTLKMRLRTFALATLVLAGTCLSSRAQSGPLTEAIRHESISGDLANALAQIACLSHLPLIAELAQPLPGIQIAEGSHSAQYLLQEVVRQAPGYQWGVEGKVVDFYSRRLRRARFNFLNLKFPRFPMPPNLSELKLTFPTLELGLLDGVSGGGIAISGFGDAYLRENALQQVSLENVTGREILLRAANQSPTFFSMIVFPNPEPTKTQAKQEVNTNWFWQSFKEPFTMLYVQKPLR